MNPPIAASPLLAQDDGDGVPTLGGGLDSSTTPILMELEFDQSPLERLIARSTSEQRGDLFLPPRDDGDDSIFRPGNPHPDGHGGTIPIVEDDPNNDAAAQPSLVTLIAGTLCLLQAGFVWASFLSSSWFDTHLMISLALPLIKKETDQILHSTTLASLLSDMLSAEEHWAATFLIITSLIVPCLSCVCGPAWTMGDHETRKEQWRGGTLRRGYNSIRYDPTWMSPRLFLEYIMRVCFTAFFLLCVLDVGTSSIEINSNNTRFVVNNQIQGGLACFTIGITCSILIILLLRAAKTTLSTTNYTEEQRNHPQQRQHHYHPLPIGGSTATGAAPPSGAFQLPWNILSQSTVEGTLTVQQQGDQELQAPLLGSPQQPLEGLRNDDATPPTSNYTSQVISRQQLSNHFDVDTTQYENVMMPFWKRAVIYELAALSTLLWLPALFFPLFELTYGGIVSDFMPEVSFSVRFWELPAVLWQRGIAAGTAKWVLTIVGSILVLFVYVCPLLATLLAIGTWTMEPMASAYCKNVLWTTQPCISGIVFALALQLAIPTFEAVGDYAIDTGSSGLCKKFEIFTSDTCMTIVGEPRMGLWFLLVQSFSLEAFIALTLVWKQR